MSDIIASFPHTAFTKLNCSNKGKPDHAALTLLDKEVFENARAIYSSLGTGRHGHLFLVVSDQRYCTLTGAAAAPVHPANPGVQPLAGGTQHEIAQADRIHKDALAQFKTSVIVEAHLKKLILEAVPSTYLDELSDAVMGFSNVSCVELLTHLHTTYGTVSPDDLETNLKNLNRQWNPDQPLTDLWAQIKLCQDFATNSAEPITDATVIRITLKNLEDSGVFTQDVRDWRKLPAANHTIANLKRHFNEADVERIRLLSSKSAGYAHQAKALPTPNPAPSSTLPTFEYCWSHGLSLAPNPRKPHTSKTCTTKLEHHCDDATLTNRMGGCNIIRKTYKDRGPIIWQNPRNKAAKASACPPCPAPN